MMTRRLTAAFTIIIAGLVSVTAQAQPSSAPPAVNPREWRTELQGPPSQVLTIGSTHLSALPPTVTPAMLEPLIARLVAFRPEIVTYEGLSGEQCDLVQANPAIYPGIADDYCWSPEPARLATGLSVSGARAAIETTLASWPSTPTPADRRRLASLFYAANDRPSAYVQWLQLPLSERRAGDGVDTGLVALMTRNGPRMNENMDIAAVVAARAGLNRVYAVDDHTADAVIAPPAPGFDAAMQRLWASPEAAALQGEQVRLGAAIQSGDAMLAYYRYLNQPNTMRAFLDVDHHAAVRTTGPDSALIRRYVAWWETRNLRMVANIRAAMGRQPGARVLNIVGASHKAYYDAYLSMMTDLDIVDAEVALR